MNTCIRCGKKMYGIISQLCWNCSKNIENGVSYQAYHNLKSSAYLTEQIDDRIGNIYSKHMNYPRLYAIKKDMYRALKWLEEFAKTKKAWQIKRAYEYELRWQNSEETLTYQLMSDLGLANLLEV